MTEWSSYSLSDFLLFSVQAYEGMFEILNATLWPIHVLTFAIGVAIAVLVLRPGDASTRLVCGTLAVLWIWIGWHFLATQYAVINWAAAYVAPVFAAQGLLFGLFAVMPKWLNLGLPASVPSRLALALLLFAVALYPVASFALGRPWHSVEFFGISPDPTVVATLAILALSRGALSRIAWVVPLLWCAISGLTLWGLGSAEFLIAPVAAVTAIALTLFIRREA